MAVGLGGGVGNEVGDDIFFIIVYKIISCFLIYITFSRLKKYFDTTIAKL